MRMQFQKIFQPIVDAHENLVHVHTNTLSFL
jgi:hypothetical protein